MKALTVPTEHVPGRAPVRIKLLGLTHALESFEILVFLNLPPGEVDTAGPDHPRFVGSFTMFGFGAPQAPGEQVPKSAPFDLTADLFPPQAPGAAQGAGNQLTLVLRTPEGERLDPALLQFDRVAIESNP